MLNIYQTLEIPEEDKLTAVGKKEAEFIYLFLHKLGKKQQITRTLETGFGYGCSTAHIMLATNAKHIAIDPCLEKGEKIGLKNIDKFGLKPNLQLIKSKSHSALPKLLSKKVEIDFGFIDGDHKFDSIFVDWFYIDLLLKQGGYVMFDDSWLGSTHAVASFIRNNREDYKEIKTPIKNIYLFKKISSDQRPWNHYRKFYTIIS